MDKILIIIVIYNKNIMSVFNNLKLFSWQRKIDILFYDNSQKPQCIPNINKVNFYYMHDSNNPGVSKAYNIGIQKAKELDKQCVLLLDQDTEFDLSLLQKYMSLYKKYGDSYIYAPIVCNKICNKIYSPLMLNKFIGKAHKIDKFIYGEIYDLSGQSVINSGLMIPVKIIDKIGNFNEKIKLDFSDYYFIEKYKHYNKSIILVNEKISHSLSGDEQKDFSKEMHRYKYYCIGAKEMSNSLNVSTKLAVLRRMIRLIIKYRSIKPIDIVLSYYFKEDKI